MPNFPWTKSNRSHHSVDNTVVRDQPSPVPSAKEASDQAAAAQRYQASDAHQPPVHSQQSSLQPPASSGSTQGQYSEYHSLRNATHRLSAHLSLGQPSQNCQQQPSPPPTSQAGHESPNHVPYQPHSPPPAYSSPENKKQSLRSRIAAGVRGHKDEETKAQKNGLSRRQSVRKSDPRAHEYHAQAESRPPHWHQHQGSSSHLPTSREQDEDNLDPFLQQESDESPQVPPKDTKYQQNVQHPQPFAAQLHQEPYVRPPLGRVSTEGSYSTQGGVDQYGPEQHQQGQGPQQQQQQQQQQPTQQQQVHRKQPQHSYQPTTQSSTGSGNFQTYIPQNAPSSLSTQPHGQGAPVQDIQQNYYQYQQQQQQQPPPAHNQSSLENSPQSLHHQQPHFVSQLQPQPDQRQPQTALPIAQLQTELHHPQAIRQHYPQTVQQSIEPQQSQQRRPPSSHQLAPPSPLQPTPYQHNESQQGKHPLSSELHSLNNASHQQGQEGMTPSAQSSSRSTVRKVNESSQSQPGAPSQESSQLQPPSAQGQTFGQPPVSPGLATFDANVVNKAQKWGGRHPPPRTSASEMTEEEIEKMIKDHDVLRQKILFEQQTQVHQLQNTLANQRLSVSRTSWDDSEYSTRFNRLDGLIAQLSFSIRKDWKSIPQWLHPVVNKTAVETGKQEMTAVGRAFISQWLVENIFDKYFHPDLEPAFSTQLQSIVSNIRKFSPPCHSPEDEESLAAKIVSWRLATLEGLADSLKAPQATTYREKLTETLNEKLIASLQIHLNDPAPPDLNGGVPMIIELAISIAQHLPLESREVQIEYFPPGHGIVSDLMKLESGIPALTAPIVELDDADRISIRSMASKPDDGVSVAEQDQIQPQVGQTSKEDKKRSMFGFATSKKAGVTPASLGKRESSLGQGGSQQSLTQKRTRQLDWYERRVCTTPRTLGCRTRSADSRQNSLDQGSCVQHMSFLEVFYDEDEG
ncbi:hypothetical protein J3E74DRAFT_423056 [Bipolaris maydis]|nr:hypothetical protein J3E74DRAFT_423056 [Bipolaris maydis]